MLFILRHLFIDDQSVFTFCHLKDFNIKLFLIWITTKLKKIYNKQIVSKNYQIRISSKEFKWSLLENYDAVLWFIQERRRIIDFYKYLFEKLNWDKFSCNVPFKIWIEIKNIKYEMQINRKKPF